MGWCGTYQTYANNLEAVIDIEGLDRSKIAASSTSGSEVYIAYRYEDSVVCLVSLVRKSRGETAVKCMSESMIPYYFSPSLKVLNALTEPQCEDAARWRQTCAEVRAQKAEARARKAQSRAAMPDLTLGQALRVKAVITTRDGNVEVGEIMQYVEKLPRKKCGLVFNSRVLGKIRMSKEQVQTYLETVTP